MAVAIRLSRQGSKKRPVYRIVAAEKRSARDGRFIELLGTYDPRTKTFKVDVDRYDRWVAQGATPSETIHSLVKRHKRAQAEQK